MCGVVEVRSHYEFECRCFVSIVFLFARWERLFKHFWKLFLLAKLARFCSRTVMDYIFSITGSGARVVRDAISQRLWPGPVQDSVHLEQHNTGTTHDRSTVYSRTGQSHNSCARWEFSCVRSQLYRAKQACSARLGECFQTPFESHWV